MTDQTYVLAAQIRIAGMKNPKIQARNLAGKPDIREVPLVATFVGIDATRIDPNPDAIMRQLKYLGDLMARAGWTRMTDTHQFIELVSKLKMPPLVAWSERHERARLKQMRFPKCWACSSIGASG